MIEDARNLGTLATTRIGTKKRFASRAHLGTVEVNIGRAESLRVVQNGWLLADFGRRDAKDARSSPIRKSWPTPHLANSPLVDLVPAKQGNRQVAFHL